MFVDKDGGGSVFFEEFFFWFWNEKGLECVNDNFRYYYIRKVIDEFKKYDRDGNGIIDKDELKFLLKVVDYCYDFNEVFWYLDISGDGKILFFEFLVWLNWLLNWSFLY